MTYYHLQDVIFGKFSDLMVIIKKITRIIHDNRLTQDTSQKVLRDKSMTYPFPHTCSTDLLRYKPLVYSSSRLHY